MNVLRRLLDPPLPADGSCAECGGERKMPAKKSYRGHAELDPFCSTDCCKRWYLRQVALAGGTVKAW